MVGSTNRAFIAKFGLNMRRRRWRLFDGYWSYAAMPNSSAMKVACAIASSFATHLALPFRIICTASIPCNVRQAVRNEPYPFASHVRLSPCDGLAPRHYSSACVNGDEPDGEEHLLPSTLHGSRIGRVLVHADHSGHAIAGERAQGPCGRSVWPPAPSRLAVSRNSMVW